MTSSGRRFRLALVSALEEFIIWHLLVCVFYFILGREGYLGYARVALERIDCFIDIADYGWMFDAGDMVGWDCVEWSCSLLVCHGYVCIGVGCGGEGSSCIKSSANAVKNMFLF